MKFNNLVNTFTSGEWSPKMLARTDTDQYTKACQKLQNFIPLIQGGAFRRGGTRHVSMDDTSTNLLGANTKLFPYNTSDGNTYMIMANDVTVANWRVLDTLTGTIYTVTGTTGNTTTARPTVFQITQVGDLVFLVDSLGITRPRVFYKSAGTFYLSDYYQYVITFGLLNTQFWKIYPYLGIQADGSSVNLTASGTSGSVTLTASGALFNVGHIGAFFKMTDVGHTGVLQVTAYTSSTAVTAFWVGGTGSSNTLGAAVGTAWEESAWSDYRGWPRTITAFQSRIVYGGSPGFPDTLWGTRIGNVFDLMEVPFVDDPSYAPDPSTSSIVAFGSDNSRPYTLSPSSAEVSNIVGLGSHKVLIINTDKYEIMGYGSQGALGANDVNFESDTAFGAARVQPVRVGNFSTFVQRGGLKIRDVIYNFQEDQYKSTDLSFPADHLFLRDDYDSFSYASINEMAVTRYDSILWIRQQSNQLIGVTLDRDYQVNGFFRMDFKTFDESASALVTAIGSGGLNLDTLFMVTLRTPGGRGATYQLEQLTPIYQFANQEITSDLSGAGFAFPINYIFPEYSKGPTYLDCWKAVNYGLGSTKTTIFSGFQHLAGYTVDVIVDGYYVGRQVVPTSGFVTSPLAGTVALVGIPYDSIIVTNPIEQGQQVPGTPQAFIKRIDQATIKFWNSYGCQYGVSETDLFDIPFIDTVLSQTDQPPEMYTGNKIVMMPSTYDQGAQVVIKQDKPWPCNVLAVVSRGVLYD